MASNYTENYGLCQWEATDQVLRTEFNEDNAKLDDALNKVTEKVTLLEETIENLGDCKISYSTYTGNATYGKENCNTLFFLTQPLLVAIVNQTGGLYCFTRYSTSLTPGNGTIGCTWLTAEEGITLSWYSTASAIHQFNSTQTYHVFAFFPMS